MTQYKDFQGKSLDEAIKEACDYFGVPREKLEIEIISDAKSGIFGLVGAKKASIRASRVQIEAVSSFLEADRSVPEEDAEAGGRPGKAPRPGKADKPKPSARTRESKAALPPKQDKRATGVPSSAESDQTPLPGGSKNAPKNAQAADKPSRQTGRVKPQAQADKTPDKENTAKGPRGKGRTKEQANIAPAPDGDGFAPDFSLDAGTFSPENGRDDLPEFDLASCDKVELAGIVENTVLRLVESIVGKVPCGVEFGSDRVRVSLDCGDASGLLVGREGQTLAAVQYLATRIIARRIGGALRLHIDAGNYRERQDDRLKELAHTLAARVKKTRKPQSTRPLSAYQRRLVHLALEDDPEITTRSKGEGTQRRVVVYLEKNHTGTGREKAGDPGHGSCDGFAQPGHALGGAPQAEDDFFEQSEAHEKPDRS